MQLRKALSPAEKVVSTAPAGEQEPKEDEDESVLNEMEELANAVERKKKRAKKILAKRRAKVPSIFLLPSSFRGSHSYGSVQQLIMCGKK